MDAGYHSADVEFDSLVSIGNFGEVYVGQLSVTKDNETILRIAAIKTIKSKLSVNC